MKLINGSFPNANLYECHYIVDFPSGRIQKAQILVRDPFETTLIDETLPYRVELNITYPEKLQYLNSLQFTTFRVLKNEIDSNL